MKRFISRSINKCSLVFIGCIVIWFVYEIQNNNKFWDAKAIEILPVLLGVVIALFVTESMTDLRRRNDCIEHIILEIEYFVSDDNNFKINKNTLLRQSSCANRIKYLKDASFSDIKSEIEFIELQYEKIRDLYSEHNSDEQTLEKVRDDIDKHRINIGDKCEKIRVSLYI